MPWLGPAGARDCHGSSPGCRTAGCKPEPLKANKLPASIRNWLSYVATFWAASEDNTSFGSSSTSEPRPCLQYLIPWKYAGSWRKQSFQGVHSFLTVGSLQRNAHRNQLLAVELTCPPLSVDLRLRLPQINQAKARPKATTRLQWIHFNLASCVEHADQTKPFVASKC